MNVLDKHGHSRGRPIASVDDVYGDVERHTANRVRRIEDDSIELEFGRGWHFCGRKRMGRRRRDWCGWNRRRWNSRWVSRDRVATLTLRQHVGGGDLAATQIDADLVHLVEVGSYDQR